MNLLAAEMIPVISSFLDAGDSSARDLHLSVKSVSLRVSMPEDFLSSKKLDHSAVFVRRVCLWRYEIRAVPMVRSGNLIIPTSTLLFVSNQVCVVKGVQRHLAVLGFELEDILK